MKILLTGSNGVIGNVLKQELKHDITEFDLPHNDARQYKQLMAAPIAYNTTNPVGWVPQDGSR